MANNRRSRNRNKGKKKFTGQSHDVLKGHVIAEDCAMPLPRQYDLFSKALKYATGTTNPNVYKALRDQKRLEMKDFIPDKGKEMEWFSEYFGAWSINEKEALLKECWKDRLELAVEEHVEYDSDYSNIFL